MRVLMMVMLHTLGMLVLMLALLLPIFLPWQFLLPMNVDIYFGSRDPAPYYPGNLQPRPKLCRGVKRGDGFRQHSRRNSSIHQRAQKHVAADAGKTFEVSDAHRIQNLLATGD